MDNRPFNVRSILAGQAPKDVAIKVKGWVRTRRGFEGGHLLYPPVGRIFVPSGSGSRAKYPIQLLGCNIVPLFHVGEATLQGEIDVVVRRLLQMGDLL